MKTKLVLALSFLLCLSCRSQIANNAVTKDGEIVGRLAPYLRDTNANGRGASMVGVWGVGTKSNLQQVATNHEARLAGLEGAGSGSTGTLYKVATGIPGLGFTTANGPTAMLTGTVVNAQTTNTLAEILQRSNDAGQYEVTNALRVTSASFVVGGINYLSTNAFFSQNATNSTGGLVTGAEGNFWYDGGVNQWTNDSVMNDLVVAWSNSAWRMVDKLALDSGQYYLATDFPGVWTNVGNYGGSDTAFPAGNYFWRTNSPFKVIDYESAVTGTYTKAVQAGTGIVSVVAVQDGNAWTFTINGPGPFVASDRLASNVWDLADSTTNYTRRTGDTMTGNLIVPRVRIGSVAWIDYASSTLSITNTSLFKLEGPSYFASIRLRAAQMDALDGGYAQLSIEAGDRRWAIFVASNNTHAGTAAFDGLRIAQTTPADNTASNYYLAMNTNGVVLGPGVRLHGDGGGLTNLQGAGGGTASVEADILAVTKWEGSAAGWRVDTLPVGLDDVSGDNIGRGVLYTVSTVTITNRFQIRLLGTFTNYFPMFNTPNQGGGVWVYTASNSAGQRVVTSALAAAFTTYTTNIPSPGGAVSNLFAEVRYLSTGNVYRVNYGKGGAAQ